jgi:hypothetical protein
MRCAHSGRGSVVFCLIVRVVLPFAYTKVI